MGTGDCICISMTGGAPWGFRLQGGKEQKRPLLVAKIRSQSKASGAGLCEGDEVVSINGSPCADLTYPQVIQLMENIRDSLQILVKRPSSGINDTWISETEHQSRGHIPQAGCVESTTLQIRPAPRCQDRQSCVAPDRSGTPLAGDQAGRLDFPGSQKEAAGLSSQVAAHVPHAQRGGLTEEGISLEEAGEGRPGPVVELRLSLSQEGHKDTGVPGAALPGAEKSEPPDPDPHLHHSGLVHVNSVPVNEKGDPPQGSSGIIQIARGPELRVSQARAAGAAGLPCVEVILDCSDRQQTEGCRLQAGNGGVDAPGEGGPSQAPPSLVSFAVSSEGTEQGEDPRWDRDHYRPHKHRARHARLRRSESLSEKQVKEAKSRCKSIALLLTDARDPHSKGVLMFKKRRRRARQFTLVSYGTGRLRRPGGAQEDGDGDDPRPEAALPGASDSDAEQELPWDADHSPRSFDWDSGLAGIEGQLRARPRMEMLPDTTGKGALMFARRRERMERMEHTEHTEHTERTEHPGRIERTGRTEHPGLTGRTEHPGRMERTEHPGRMEHPGRTGRTEHPGLTGRTEHPGRMERTEHPGRMEHTEHPGRMERTEHPGRMEHPGRTERTEHPGRMERTEHPGRMEHPGRTERTEHPGRMERTEHPGRMEHPGRTERTEHPGRMERPEQDAGRAAAAAPRDGPDEAPVRPGPAPGPAPQHNGFPGAPGTVRTNRTARPFPGAAQLPPPPPWPQPAPWSPPAGCEEPPERLASRDERIAVPAKRTGLLQEAKRRSTAKPMFTFKEPKVSPNPELLSLLQNPEGKRGAGGDSGPEEDSLSLGAEACNFMQGPSALHKTPPPVAPKPAAKAPPCAPAAVAGARAPAGRTPGAPPELPGLRGKGAQLFARRQSRMERYVVDADTVQAHAGRAPSPTPSLPAAWKYSSNVRAPPPVAYNPLQSPSYPLAALKPQPPACKAGKKKAKKPLNALDVMKHQPYQLNASLFTFQPPEARAGLLQKRPAQASVAPATQPAPVPRALHASPLPGARAASVCSVPAYSSPPAFFAEATSPVSASPVPGGLPSSPRPEAAAYLVAPRPKFSAKKSGVSVQVWKPSVAEE